MRLDGKMQIAVLIFARNEASVIGETVKNIVQVLGVGDELFVIADNCTDDTARIASDAGAHVYARTIRSTSSKGQALAWFLSSYYKLLQSFDFLLILDADSRIALNFLDIIKDNIPAKGEAFQCFIFPIYNKQSPIGNLAALSYLLDQSISDKIRTRLGWPVRLRGTGMLIATGVFREIINQLDTSVEDIALSLLLSANGVHVGRFDQAVVYDPVPDSSDAASRQRARWFRGQWFAAWQYRKEISNVLTKGPGGWSLLSSLFLKPRWLILTISLLLALVLSRWWWISLFFWGQVFFGLLYLTIGLIILPERKTFVIALIHLPTYIYMWVRSILLSLRSTHWLKARKEQ